jgi:hypothetical protein
MVGPLKICLLRVGHARLVMISGNTNKILIKTDTGKKLSVIERQGKRWK